MKKIFFIVAFLVALVGQAQDKITIAVTRFSSSGTWNASMFSNSLTELAVNAVVKSGRFTVVDRTSFDAVFAEENLQKGEGFIEGLVVAQGKKTGAQYIITGNLTGASAEERYTGGYGSTPRRFEGYVGKINYTLKLLDVETGVIKASESLSNSSGTFWAIFETTYGTQEEAISQAIQASNPFILKFIDTYFPVKMKIFEIVEEKKGEAKKITIAAGSGKGVQVGQDLRVVEFQKVEVDGKAVERTKVIGMVRVQSVDDENFSTCKVRDGGALIKQKFDNKSDIYILSGAQ